MAKLQPVSEDAVRKLLVALSARSEFARSLLADSTKKFAAFVDEDIDPQQMCELRAGGRSLGDGWERAVAHVLNVAKTQDAVILVEQNMLKTTPTPDWKIEGRVVRIGDAWLAAMDGDVSIAAARGFVAFWLAFNGYFGIVVSKQNLADIAPGWGSERSIEQLVGVATTVFFSAFDAETLAVSI